jgi:hypothetical protein
LFLTCSYWPRISALRALLAAGANPNARDGRSRSCLHEAAWAGLGNPEAIQADH